MAIEKDFSTSFRPLSMRSSMQHSDALVLSHLGFGDAISLTHAKAIWCVGARTHAALVVTTVHLCFAKNASVCANTNARP
jgi:hypothetical protein